MPQYDLTEWQDLPSKATPINADNLNKIEQCLKKLCHTAVTNVDPYQGGSGVIWRNGNVCQMSVTLDKLRSGNSSFSIPAEFTPALDSFQAPIFSRSSGVYLGNASYSKNVNAVVPVSIDGNDVLEPAVFSITYICED